MTDREPPSMRDAREANRLLTGQDTLLPTVVPKIDIRLTKKGGPYRRWAMRLVNRELGEDPQDPRTWIADALWEDAVAEAMKIREQEGYGDLRHPSDKAREPIPGAGRRRGM